MISFAQHQDLFTRFSQLLEDASVSGDRMISWARFLTVADAGELQAIIDAMEMDATMIDVLTQNLTEKLELVEHNAPPHEWDTLFSQERGYLQLQQ